MLLQRQQLAFLGGQQRRCSTAHECSNPIAAFRASRTARSSVGRLATVTAAAAPSAADAGSAAAAAAPPAASSRKGRKYGPRKKDVEEQPAQPPEPPLPVPLDYQQTLIKSFTIGGVGLHSGEYTWVRVRPAFAGEGRYFVRVPEGTNKNRFEFEDDSSVTDKVPLEAVVDAADEGEDDEDLEDQRVEWFEVYLIAQEERGFEGSFRDFLDIQVKLGELGEDMRRRLLGLTADDFDDEDLPLGSSTLQPNLSMDPEEIEPLDPDDPTVVMAAITSVSELDLPFTQLGQGDNRVMTVELLLSALEACGVDNARIELEGGNEIPVLDNSALGWCVEIQIAGMRPAPIRFADQVPDGGLAVAQRDVLAPSKAVAVQDEDGWIAFFPGPFANITFGVDHTKMAPVIGSMWHTWHSDDEHFRYSLAPARGYAESIQQLFAMRDAGFVQAGAENLFNIAHGDKWWDPEMLRMVYDEPVRYRLAQLIGNLSLLNIAGCQGVPVGHVTAFNASPALQLAFVRGMLESVQQDDVMSLNASLRLQESYWNQRAERFWQRDGTSQGVTNDLGDGTPAVVEAEVMGDDEEV